MLLGVLVDCCISHSDLLFLQGVAAHLAQNNIRVSKSGHTESALLKLQQASMRCSFASV